MSEIITPTIEGFDSFNFIRERGGFSLWTANDILNKRKAFILASDKSSDKSEVSRTIAVYKYVQSTADKTGIISIYEVRDDVEFPYIITEYVDSPSLFDRVIESGPFDTPSTLRIAGQIARALNSLGADREIVLRNLKPDNIKIDSAGNVKLCEFNLAVFPKSKNHNLADKESVVGTPQYISPEQVQAKSDLDFRSDLYSLGAVLYFVCTGVVPFDSENAYEVLEKQLSGQLKDPQLISDKVTYSLARLLSYMMLKDRIYRYACWDDFLSDVERAERHAELALVVPNDIAVTIAVTKKKTLLKTDNRANAQAGNPPEDENKVNLNKLDLSKIRERFEDAGLPKNRAAKGKVKVSPGVSIVFWVIFSLWILYYANYNLGSVCRLPFSSSVDKLSASVNRLLGAVFSGGGNRSGASDRNAVSFTPRKTPDESRVQITVVDSSRSEDDSTQAESVDSSQVTENASSRIDDISSVSDVDESPLELESNLKTRAVDCIKRRDFKGAAKIVSAASGTEEIEKILLGGENIDTLIVTLLMREKGKPVKITYMGKEREIIPRSSVNYQITTTHEGRPVKIDVRKFSQKEKLRLLDAASNDSEHLGGISLALQLNDKDALKRHLDALPELKALFR